MIASMNRSQRQSVSGAVRRLADEGLVASDQIERIDARLQELLFPAAAGDGAGRAAKLIAWLGGLLIAAGILSLIGLNWDHLGKWVKLFLVGFTLVGLHVAGWRLQVEPGRHPAVGLALTGAAMLCFGGAIAVVAQIYHLDSHWPNAILVWWLLNVPFVLIYGSRLLLTIVVALFSIWGFWLTNVWCDDHHMRGWFGLHDVAWGYATLGLAIAVAGAGALARDGRFDPFASLLGAFAKLGALAGLFLMSFQDFLHDRSMPDGQTWLDPERLHRMGVMLSPAGWFAAGGLVLLAIGAIRRTGWRASGAWREEPLDAVAIALAAACVALFDLALPPAAFLAGNVLLLAAVVGLIVRGIRLGRVGDVNLALAAFLVTAIARYFEYFADGFGPALGFLIAGILLLVLGFFIEKLRRRIVAQARRSAS